MTGTVIGHITITEPIEYTYRGYETASWYKVLRLTPGTYEVRATYRWNECGCARGQQPKPEQLMATIPGVITDEHFPSSFYGVQFGEIRKDNVGRDDSVVWTWYGYQVNDIGRANGKVTFELADGFEVIPGVNTYQGAHEPFGAYAVRMADVEAYNAVHTRHPIHLCEATCAA